MAPTSVRQRAIQRLIRLARFLAEQGLLWESWYLATDVLSPILSETERSTLRSELVDLWSRSLNESDIAVLLGERDVLSTATPTQLLASVRLFAHEQPEAFTSGRLKARIIQSVPTIAYTGSSRTLGRTLRRAAYDFVKSGDYRSAMHTVLLAPLAAAAPRQRPNVLTQLWNYAMPVASSRVRLTSGLSHLILDKGYPAVAADSVADALDESSDAQMRDIWKELNISTVRPVVGGVTLPGTFRAVFNDDAAITADLAKVERELTGISSSSSSVGERLSFERRASDPEFETLRDSMGSHKQDLEESDSTPGDVPPEPPGPKKPEFYFALEGDHVSGNQVKAETDFDLVFNYDMPPEDVLVIVTGERLDDLRVKDADLDIWVSPFGAITTRDEVGIQTARFRGGRLPDPVRFKLRAGVGGRASLHVEFRYQQRRVYSLVIELQIVSDVTRGAPRRGALWDLDQREWQQMVENRGPVQATLQLWAEGEHVYASLVINQEATGRPIPLTISLTTLATFLENRQADIQPVAQHPVWLTAASPFAAVPAIAERDVLDCLARVASAGSSLYANLSDNGLASLLSAIDALPTGARILIQTDRVFLPLEILYPPKFAYERWIDNREATAIDVHRFWGYRFTIETRLFTKDSEGSSASPRQAGVLNLSFNINSAIDRPFATVTPKPAASHVEYYDRSRTRFPCELQATGAEIKKRLLAADNSASLIYLFCHGQTLHPFQPGQQEKLEFDPDTAITPDFLNDDGRFSGQPVVVINSCSSGAFTPLALSTFLSRFRQRGALGLISTTFPVPATVASVVGQRLLDEYVNERALGAVLCKLRRDALDLGHPVPLFYTTQCDMDTTAPSRAKRAA